MHTNMNTHHIFPELNSTLADRRGQSLLAARGGDPLLPQGPARLDRHGPHGKGSDGRVPFAGGGGLWGGGPALGAAGGDGGGGGVGSGMCPCLGMYARAWILVGRSFGSVSLIYRSATHTFHPSPKADLLPPGAPRAAGATDGARRQGCAADHQRDGRHLQGFSHLQGGAARA